MNSPSKNQVLGHDAEVLERLGYRQELERRLGQFSNFSVSFSIICILAGGINSFAQATSGAGGAGIGLGWPIGCAMSGVFAICMAQIASSFPTAGGLYHWASVLGNRFWGWITAWLNLLGLITILGSVNVGAWSFLVGAFGGNMGVENTLTNQMLFLGLLGSTQAWINHRGIELTSRLTNFSGVLILLTSLVIIGCFISKAGTWDWARLGRFENFTGPAGGDVWPQSTGWWPFLLGLLLPVYTITGYDASAHTSEETIDAERNVPKGMVSSVLYASIAGFLLLSVMMLSIPNLGDAAKQGWNVFFWLLTTQLDPALRNTIFAAILLAQLLCGLAAVTSASRVIYAFARDKGLPFSNHLAEVNPKYKTPGCAVWCSSFLAFSFVWISSLITFAGATAYAMVVSCAVILLFLSCIVPIVCGMIAAGTHKWPEAGKWSIGFGMFRLVGLAAIVSMITIFIIGIRPPNQAALHVCIVVGIVLGIGWFAHARHHFVGPSKVTLKSSPPHEG